MKQLIDSFGGRKFFYCLIFIICFTAMLIMGYLSGDQYVTATLGTIGALIASNTITTIGYKNGNNESKLPANPDQPPRD